MTMKNYLHFTAGDNLLFQAWHPNSSGAIAGACIGLVLVAFLERWLSATRAGLEHHWHQKALALTANDDSAGKRCEDDAASVKSGFAAGRKTRNVAPFIASQDVSRGVIYAVQALLGYVLMLNAMTFQAAYLISIVLGLGIGEVLFGRMNRF
ncbi:Ctr copper transporter [Lentinula aciculospora]|uniref:Copper transport protein n=1 Tax=Lentinula aciculospora TaxID=153920 RepID=A0A9W9A9C7_9AGAR|nr:Ctr copper transporter [Lentinula aciculospora]